MSFDPPQRATPAFAVPGDADRATGFEKLRETGIYGFDSKDIRSRPFTLLRAQVLRIARARGWKIIGVTSPTPKVGKSFVASNLAAALARTPELHTYLFDFDLRRSTIARNFRLSGEVGLSHFLDGTITDLREVAKTISNEHLTIFPSFPNGAASDELVSSTRMDALIAAMRQLPENTLCLCDLPPVFANDDAVVISQKIDAYLMIVEDGVTTRKEVRDSFRLLSPAPCIGTVLNRYDAGLMGGDYGYGYGQNKRYGGYYDD
ncbi:CpsD/CapB family tyrosine-protein kinase [Rhizorhabdus argentea]|uniref:CpsD/CapB family tyrosine-protein kinase n=1 Tax=Rhizorhabdus argentea TaxID=1387174 RepID=UPI0030EB3436